MYDCNELRIVIRILWRGEESIGFWKLTGLFSLEMSSPTEREKN